MGTVSLVALKRHPYGKRTLTPGESYTANSEGDAHILTTMGMAKRAETPAEPMRVRPMPPAPEIPAAPTEAKPAATGASESASDERRRRTYKRRDLTADD